jgi:hypothetical protein
MRPVLPDKHFLPTFTQQGREKRPFFEKQKPGNVDKAL